MQDPGLSGPPPWELTDAYRLSGRKPRKWPYITTIVVLFLGVIGAGAAYAYSTNSADRWKTTAERNARDLASMTAERDDLTAKNSSLAAQLSSSNTKLSDTTTQLNDTNARIRSLANEKAQLGDNAAALSEVLAASEKVSSQMSTCIGDLKELQRYLVNFEDYEQASLIRFVQDVNSQCNAAQANSDSLTEAIQRLR